MQSEFLPTISIQTDWINGNEMLFIESILFGMYSKWDILYKTTLEVLLMA